MGRVWLLVALCGCGRFGFNDASRGDGGGPPDVLGLSLDATIVADGVLAAPCGSTVLLQDGFDVAGAAPTFGSYTKSGLTLRETTSALEVVFGTSVSDGNYAGYKSVVAPPSEGLCGSVHVLQVAGSNGLTFFKLLSQGTDVQQVELAVYQGFLSARTHLDKQVAVLFSIPFDISAHGWWRLRQQGGTTYWDVSGDGVSYTLLASTTFITDPTLKFEVGAGSYGSSSNAGLAAFDDALLTGP